MMRGVVNPRARSNGSHNLKRRLKGIISAAVFCNEQFDPISDGYVPVDFESSVRFARMEYAICDSLKKFQ